MSGFPPRASVQFGVGQRGRGPEGIARASAIAGMKMLNLQMARPRAMHRPFRLKMARLASRKGAAHNGSLAAKARLYCYRSNGSWGRGGQNRQSFAGRRCRRGPCGGAREPAHDAPPPVSRVCGVAADGRKIVGSPRPGRGPVQPLGGARARAPARRDALRRTRGAARRDREPLGHRLRDDRLPRGSPALRRPADRLRGRADASGVHLQRSGGDLRHRGWRRPQDHLRSGALQLRRCGAARAGGAARVRRLPRADRVSTSQTCCSHSRSMPARAISGPYPRARPSA